MSDERSEGRSHGDQEGWLERLIGRWSGRGRESMRDDLAEVLSEATEAADLSPRERQMLENVLGFHRVRVSDVMVPRADMVAVSSEAALSEVLSVFRTAGHSRLPVYGETPDEPLGMIHIRDFLDLLAGGGPGGGAEASLGDVDLSLPLSSASILRPVLFVPRAMPAIDLLARMQASRTHMALVIDEYGGTDGIVSIEDLVETVVGDIEDEHDETETMLTREENGCLLADARASLEEVSEAVGHDLSADEGLDEVDTLGGLITTSVGRVPVRGELIEGPAGLRFEVLDADRRRLKRVRIHPPAAANGPASSVGLSAHGAPASDGALRAGDHPG